MSQPGPIAQCGPEAKLSDSSKRFERCSTIPGGEPGSLVGTRFDLPGTPCAAIYASRPASPQATAASS